MDAAAYNYANFDRHVADEGREATEGTFRSTFHAGDRAEDFELLRLDDGARVRLSDLWRTRPLVMEFGSFT